MTPHTRLKELLACPFCGKRPEIASGYDDTWLIRHACKPNDAHGTHVHIQANWKSEVADTWNTRANATHDALVERVGVLERLLEIAVDFRKNPEGVSFQAAKNFIERVQEALTKKGAKG